MQTHRASDPGHHQFMYHGRSSDLSYFLGLPAEWAVARISGDVNRTYSCGHSSGLSPDSLFNHTACMGRGVTIISAKI